jgi:hypothetical protein
VNIHGFRAARAVTLSLALVALLPAAANAATGKVEVEHQRGPLVNALFTSMDGSGCVETDTFVTANRSTDHHGSSSLTSVIAGVSVFAYDLCSETVVLQAAGEVDTLSLDAFRVSNQLDQASLQGEIAVTNLDTGAAFTITVDVTWSGTSAIHRDHSNTNDQYPGGCHVLNRWNGSGRTATASGSVTDGLTEFTPAPTDDAEIGFVHDGFAVMGCG